MDFDGAKQKEGLDNWGCSDLQETKRKSKKPTTPGIPRRSPIQVLTGPDAAWLRWSDENRYIQRGMVVGEWWGVLRVLIDTVYITRKRAVFISGRQGDEERRSWWCQRNIKTPSNDKRQSIRSPSQGIPLLCVQYTRSKPQSLFTHDVIARLASPCINRRFGGCQAVRPLLYALHALCILSACCVCAFVGYIHTPCMGHIM